MAILAKWPTASEDSDARLQRRSCWLGFPYLTASNLTDQQFLELPRELSARSFRPKVKESAMIIYVHQRNADGTADPVLGAYYGRVAPYHASVPSNQIRHVYANPNMSISRVVAAITRASQGPRSIWRIMINCHGLPGEISLGSGLTTANAREFGGVRRFMTPRGEGILVGCCYAAAGQEILATQRGCIREQSEPGNGLSLLMELARHSGAKVVGALDEQITWDLNGPIVTVLPDYSYTVTSGREVASIRPGSSGETYLCE